MADLSSFLPNEDHGEERTVRLYTTKDCTRCPQVRAWLTKNDVEYDEVDMSSAKWMAELRIHGVFVVSAPVLQVGNEFFTPDQMFRKEQLLGLDTLLGAEGVSK